MPRTPDCTSILLPLDPTFISDPYPTYHRLRMTGPVLWHEMLGSWVVTGHRDCAGVLRDELRFRCDSRGAGREPAHTPMIQLLDGAAHRELRSAIMAAIGRRIASLDPLTVANRRASELAGKQGFCLVDDYAIPYALDCLNMTFDIPAETEPRLCRLMKDVVRSMSPQVFPEAVAAGTAARAELNELFRSSLGTFIGVNDIVAGLGAQDARDDARETVLGSIRVALLASINSVSRAIGLAARHLLDLPEQSRIGFVDRLRHIDSAQSRGAVEELIRFDPPVQAVERFVARRIRLGGVEVHRGQRLTLLLGSANRDPLVFAAPDVLEAGRTPNPHLGWGGGSHTCLGSRIGVRQVAAALTALFLAGEVTPQSPPTFQPNPALRGLHHYVLRIVRATPQPARSPL
jgi:cytochrome P450